jgi:hypothetical protein
VKNPFVDSLNGVKLSLSSVKKKVSAAKAAFVAFETEIERLEVKLDQTYSDVDNYKDKLLAEATKINEKLIEENEDLYEQLNGLKSRFEGESWEEGSAEYQDLVTRKKVATTVGIFESILGLIASVRDEDFKFMSYSFLYPAVYSKLLSDREENLILESVPESAELVVTRGRDFLEALRGASKVDLTVEEVWEAMVSEVVDWWTGTALPLLYGERNPDWASMGIQCEAKVDIQKSQSDPFFKLTRFPEVVDALTIYYENESKDEIRRDSGILDLEAKLHRYF